MKVLVDMNLSPEWASFLIEAGIDAIHWSEIGEGNEPDLELMQWAAAHDHVVLTADLDFAAILAATQRRKPSLIQLRAELPTPAAAGRSVVSAILNTKDDLTEGAIVSVDAARARLRVLPFNPK
jgi:predicted nuclease of predicted toxin-antitoxin system